jgi:hypothetical protein
MTARNVAAIASLALVCASGCTNLYEVPVETPIQAKLDVGAFRRVLVAGFISGGTDDVDANMETVRLLRSQLRTKTNLRVIEAEVLPLAELAQEQAAKASESSLPAVGEVVAGAPAAAASQRPQDPPATAPADETKKPESGGNGVIRTKQDLERYERIFADAAFWKKLGEEYEQPLIITGTIMFTPQQSAGMQTVNREEFDQLGRRIIVPRRIYQERKGFILEPKFVFIDGRTGATLYSESQRREVLYPASQSTPALASYFELMDQLIPDFLGALSTQKIKGMRTLLR